MGREIILHVGLAKTGSTSIQTALLAAKSRLLQDGVLFPGGEPNHYHLQSICADDPHNLIQVGRLGLSSVEDEKAYLESWRTSFEKELAESPDARVVLSSEYIPAMSSAELERLGAYLRTLGARLRVLAYLREPCSFAIAMIQQYLRDGLDAGPTFLGYQGPQLPLLEKLEQGLDTKIEARLYNDDVVADFADLIGAQLPRAERHNERMGFKTACLMSEFNARFPRYKNGKFHFDAARDWMAEAIMSTFPNDVPIQMSRATAKQILAESYEDRRAIEIRYFGGKRVLSPSYTQTNFTDGDDLISISRLPAEVANAALLDAMRCLAERALDYHGAVEFFRERRNQYDKSDS